MLTEDGRNQIKEDLERVKRLGQSVSDVARKESIIITDTFNHIEDVQKDLDVQKAFNLKDGGNLVSILDDKNREKYTVNQRDEALNEYAQIYANIYGVTIESAKAVATKKNAGATYTNNDNTSSRISIDDNLNNGALAVSNTMGHEVAHVRQSQGQTRDRTQGVNKDTGKRLSEEYADTMGDYSSNGMQFSSSSYNNVNLNSNKATISIVRTNEDNLRLENNTAALVNDIKESNSSNGNIDNKIYHVPGTFASKKDVSTEFKNELSSLYKGEEMQIIANEKNNDIDLENNDADRQKLAAKITDQIIKDYISNPNEPIRLSGHSNGGNVNKIVTQILVERGYENIVDSIIYFATPVKEQYKTNNKVLKNSAQVINVFDKDDIVQPYLSRFSSDEMSLSGQTIENNNRVINIQFESPGVEVTDTTTGRKFLDYNNPIQDYTNIDGKEVINQIKKVITKNE